FLKSSNMIVGLPLLIGGAALMLFGWRMWRVCVVIAFGLGGLAIGAALAGPGPNQLRYAVGCGVALAALSYWPVNFSLAILGAVVGGATVVQLLSSMGLHGSVLWILFGLAALGCAALAFINRQLVVIAVTSFLGAILLISGLTVFVMSSPSLYGAMMSHREFAVPFALLVPTIMSCFYQIAEVHRTNASL
ncbi:MAG: hypothetical protein IID43_04825, partial [Planctomycetes bacterium]|nr:hypothetical protein [Planctomycetota bacterium]